ncbi:hypothetical protein BY458DRAFT_505889 [Sporodiniella umbellata]|nr:hypothetical protein BY458DRAFT_505889 [Sporodiniella umbellata]
MLKHNHQLTKVDNPTISLQKLAQRRTLMPYSPPSSEDSDSCIVEKRVHLVSSFSVYPCHKCVKDLQPCDLTIPSCGRCYMGGYPCVYQETEPKANHVSQALDTMNRVMDQWQGSMDRMAREFAQKTKDFGQKVDQSFKKKHHQMRPFAWKITKTKKGLAVEGDVHSFNDLTTLVEQFKKAMHISMPSKEQSETPQVLDSALVMPCTEYVDDTSSIHTSSTFSFDIFSSSHPLVDYQDLAPIEITDELTDSLVHLYCNTPCCSSTRLPIVNTFQFLERYNDPQRRPPQILIYAICAAAARNAFQFHISSAQDKEHNIGKTISIIYCLKGRELLADCFDLEPTLDHCIAAFLLAYCHLQNGYSGILYIYEWITFTMAHELDLYNDSRKLTQEENMLVWCLYYFNTWYKVFQGNASSSVQIYPRSPLYTPPPKPDMSNCRQQEIVDHYIYTEWYYLIQLQSLRQEITYRLLSAEPQGGQDASLSTDMVAFQKRLALFHDTLPAEWKDVDVRSEHAQHPIDIYLLIKSCTLNVYIDYHINKVLIHQAFFPAESFPTTRSAIQSLHLCLDSALIISRTIHAMITEYDNQCNIPLFGLMFANMVYIKLLRYPGDHPYRAMVQKNLIQSIDTLKASKPYIYDLDMSSSLLNIMELDAIQAF